jgi:hypothetical protein
MVIIVKLMRINIMLLRVLLGVFAMLQGVLMLILIVLLEVFIWMQIASRGILILMFLRSRNRRRHSNMRSSLFQV